MSPLGRSSLEALRFLILSGIGHAEAFASSLHFLRISSIGLKVIREAVPAPDLPKIKSKLMPPEVHLLHEKRRRRNRIIAGIAWLAALYVISVMRLIG